MKARTGKHTGHLSSAAYRAEKPRFSTLITTYFPPYLSSCKWQLFHSFGLFSSPHKHNWSSTFINDFPRSLKLYSTFGGIWGYSVLMIKLSASSSLRFVLRVLSDMFFRYLFSSLNRTTLAFQIFRWFLGWYGWCRAAARQSGRVLR